MAVFEEHLKSFPLYTDNSLHTTLEFFWPLNDDISQEELAMSLSEQYRKYKAFATPFIGVAVLRSLDGSNSVGLLEHYKLNTDFSTLLDPAVYPQVTPLVQAVDKISTHDDWMSFEAMGSLCSSTKLQLQTLNKGDIISLDIITMGDVSGTSERVYSQAHKRYSELISDENQSLKACTIFKSDEPSKLTIIGSWESLPSCRSFEKLTEGISLQTDEELRTKFGHVDKKPSPFSGAEKEKRSENAETPLPEHGQETDITSEMLENVANKDKKITNGSEMLSLESGGERRDVLDMSNRRVTLFLVAECI